MSRIAFLAVTTSMFAGPIFAVDDLHTIEEPISFQNGKQGIFHRLDDWLENGNPARVADPNSISSRIRNNLRMTIDLSGRSVLSQRAGKSASGSVVVLGIDDRKAASDLDVVCLCDTFCGAVVVSALCKPSGHVVLTGDAKAAKARTRAAPRPAPG